jgi:hypothetical protein
VRSVLSILKMIYPLLLRRKTNKSEYNENKTHYRDLFITHEELSLHFHHIPKQLNQHEINSKISLQLIGNFQYDDYIDVKSKFKNEKKFSLMLNKSNLLVNSLHHPIISKLEYNNHHQPKPLNLRHYYQLHLYIVNVQQLNPIFQL